MTQAIKKVTIENESLPDLAVKNSFYGYKLRYRIVSDDRNRVSSWSPVYFISANGVVDVSKTTHTETKTINQSGGTRVSTSVALTWTPPSALKFYNFDIFVKTNLDSDYYFYRSTNNTSFDILFPSSILLNGTEQSVTTLSYWVQISTSNKKINTSLVLFNNENIDLTQ